MIPRVAPSSPHPLLRAWDTGAYVVALTMNRAQRHAAAALGDGTLWLIDLADPDGTPTVVPAHDGLCLTVVPDIDDTGFLTGGDDGRLMHHRPGSRPETLASFPGQWVEHVGSDPRGGRRAFGIGRRVLTLDADGHPWREPMEHSSTVGGLAFAPNGKRIAVAHYDGVSLWWTGDNGAAARLDWRGSHLGVLWHPAGTHLLTTMQEPGLHGWRLKDKADMRMSGYPTKVRSMGWTPRAKHLATSGADAVVCWPFTNGGPWDKPALELAGRTSTLVTAVAPHPTAEVIVAGYADGLVLALPLNGDNPVPLVEAAGSPVSALVWSSDGRHLVIGTEEGRLSWLPTPLR